MKKITFIGVLCFVMTLCWQTSAQVQVGTGTETTTYLPIYSCYGYTYSQQIYLASEINASGNITTLSFYLDAATSTTNFDSSTGWTVYLGHSTKTEFSSTTDWEASTSLTQVYTGTVTFPAEGNWFELTLDTSFAYNGTDNLIVAIDENQVGYNCSMAWQKTDASVNRGIVYRSDSTNPDPSSPPTASGVYTYFPNIIFGGIMQSCPTPNTLTATNIMTTTADLGWTEAGSATTWNIEVVTAGTAPTGTATDSGVTTNPFNKTGLTASTSYEFYVQADCGGETSAWAGPFAFTTLCEAFTATYTQNFDAETAPEVNSCWSTSLTGSTSTYATIEGSTTYNVSANNSVRFYNSSDTSGTYLLISPNFSDLDNTKRVKFQVYMNEGGDGDTFEVGTMSDTTDPSTYTTYKSFTNADFTEDDWTLITVNFDTYSGSDSHIVLKYNPVGTYNYWYIDDFVYELIPSCVEPSNLTASATSFTEASISWDAGGSETMWEYVVQAAGTGEPTSGTSTSNTMENVGSLTENTDYEVYVRANCGGEYSAWAGPENFSTSYCESVPTSNDNSGITNVNFQGTDFATGDVTYFDHTSVVIEINQSGTAQLSINFATGYTYDTNIWIDLNDNLEFEESELLYDGVSESTNPTTLDASFTVPVDAALGEHYMRIGTADSGQSTPNPCYSGSYGVTLDFKVNVLEALVPENDTCASPTSLTLNATGVSGDNTNATTSTNSPSCDTSGTISDVWYAFVAPASGNVTITTTVGSADQANVVVWDDCDYTTELACSAGNGGESVDLTGLTEGTTYYIQVWNDGTAAPAQRAEGTFTIAIEETTLSINSFEHNGFEYFPNPVNDKLSLRAQNNIQTVSVFNILGQEVVRMAPNTVSSTVDMSQLNNGVYFVKVRINDKTETIKIIKQ